MKLKFKKQGYQEDATNAVINVFAGNKKIESNGIALNENELINDIVYYNSQVNINLAEIRANVFKTQKYNNIPTYNGKDITNFSVEMETGTGKTYTYIKTMYELNKKYGWKKFIIIVPSIAILEGVEKSLKITQEHFQELYREKIRFFKYNSNQLGNVYDFATSNAINVMIMNYQAFNVKDKTKVGNKRKIFDTENEKYSPLAPIDFIKAVNPIIIMDEPQRITDETEKIIDEEFNPLFVLRYSATHRKVKTSGKKTYKEENKEYNKLYSLNAIDAYNQKLVKKIDVIGLELVNNKSEGTYFYLEKCVPDKTGPYAVVEYEKKGSNGIKKVTSKLRFGDNLYNKSNELQAYKGYVVSEIIAYEHDQRIIFTNGETIHLGQMTGDVDDKHLYRLQIRETIKTHLEKEQILFKKGIKVLSLFFIDKVSNYREYIDGVQTNGEFADFFEIEYNNAIKQMTLDKEYEEYLNNFNTSNIHNGYFSIDKKTKNYVDSKEKKDQGGSDDVDAYDLILKDKEKLLSFSEPTRFIFSHSALREGWDNPNVFQICTLKRGNSEISKRQELGRGLRICVDKDGNRMDYATLEEDFHNINTLTVIASESYDSFASGLQKEILESISESRIEFKIDALLGARLYASDPASKINTTLDQETLEDIIKFYKNNGYLNYLTNEVTDTFKKADVENNIEVPENLEIFKDDLIKLIKEKVLGTTYIVGNAAKKNVTSLLPNENFNKVEFQKLWNQINIKSVYEVNFDSNELIEKCIKNIDSNVNVLSFHAKRTQGSTGDSISEDKLRDGTAMEYTVGPKTTNLEEFEETSTSYDMIGEITKLTSLTRKTIVTILKGIHPDIFNQYRNNPESFFAQVSKAINTEKAATVIEGITYNKTDETYDSSIFTINNLRGTLGDSAIEVKKHIYDFIVTDSKVEQEFAKQLELGEVDVYAKLPSGFKIPTPLGNYNPDWAIVFNNDEFKEVYFIAETKGSLESLDLKGVENAKIQCAKKHFAEISNNKIKYDVVTTYEDLFNKVFK